MKKNLTKIFLGIAVVAAGVIFLGSAFGFWSLESLSGWWTVLIIAPAIGSIISTGIQFWNTAAVAVGVWLLLKCHPEWVPPEKINHFAIALALVAIGFWLIFSSLRTKHMRTQLAQDGVPASEESHPTYTAVCSGAVYKNSSGHFTGGHFSAIFGGLDVDLSNAVINEEITIDVTAIFGGVDVYLPPNVRVEYSDGASILGGIDNKLPENSDTSAPLVHIKHLNFFGGTDLKLKNNL